jgi:DNA-binding MarR family transcriptional regulator
MSKSDFNLKNQNHNTESKIVVSLERISQAFRVLLWQESKTYALSPIQIQVLIFLLNHSEEKRKVSYLADEFNLTKATISETIKTLEQKNFISKTYQLHDTRSYTIHLTKKGTEIANKTSLFTKEIHNPLSKLDQSEKENMLLNLIGIISHLNQAGVITIQRMCITCAFYQTSDKHQKHFCNLLNQSLHVNELRIDCTEHEMKA